MSANPLGTGGDAVCISAHTEAGGRAAFPGKILPQAGWCTLTPWGHQGQQDAARPVSSCPPVPHQPGRASGEGHSLVPKPGQHPGPPRSIAAGVGSRAGVSPARAALGASPSEDNKGIAGSLRQKLLKFV